MSEAETLDRRRYAAIVWALAKARGALASALQGDTENGRAVLDATSFAMLAQRFGYRESDLAIDWNDYLTTDEQFIGS